MKPEIDYSVAYQELLQWLKDKEQEWSEYSATYQYMGDFEYIRAGGKEDAKHDCADEIRWKLQEIGEWF